MIRCKLHRLMAERRMKISDVMRETGIRRTMLTLMYRDEVQRLDMDALDRLCHLFDCQVNDILEHEESDQATAAADTA
jgi:putative transcriptional regulator